MSAPARETASFDVSALRRAVENRDVAAMLRFYDDKAEISITDRDHTPSGPQVIRGRSEISSYLADVYGRDMSHRLDHVLVGDNSISFVERCRYKDGTQVTASSVIDVGHGRIVRQEGVQAWDSGQLVPRYQDFSAPDEVRTFEKGRLELLHTPAGDIGRMTLEPGWRWSEHVRPIAGTDLCQQSHCGYQISGRMRVEMADGTTLDISPGEAGTVPPGHDAWVLGNEPVVLLDWTGATDYAHG